jgi:hypothetical protein
VKAAPNIAARSHHEIEAGILMAATLASKRRPAALVDIVAAADLILGFIPFAEKLGAALERLSVRGLVCQSESGFTLTEAGRSMMSKQPRKASQEELIAAVTDSLAAWRPRSEQPPILLNVEALDIAIRAHQANRKTGKSLLMPKPEVTRHFKVEGRWRRAVKAR